MARITVSQAELRVLRLIGRGLTYSEIARQLGLSAATIAFHAVQMRSRLRVTNNVALVAVSIVYGLLTSDSLPIDLTGATDVELTEY